jgi:hypothetical protein
MNRWHELGNGREIYIEDGMVVRATKTDINGGDVPASVYEYVQGEYINACPVSVDEFFSGYETGKYTIE